MDNEESTSGCANRSLLKNFVSSFGGRKQRKDVAGPNSAGCFASPRSNSADQRSSDSGFGQQTRESTPQLPSPIVFTSSNSHSGRLSRQTASRLPSSSSASSLQFVLATHRPELPKIVQKMLRERQKEYVRLKLQQNRALINCDALSTVPVTPIYEAGKSELSGGKNQLLLKLAYCNEVRHISTTLDVISSVIGLRLLFVTLFQSIFQYLNDEYVRNRPIYVQVPSDELQPDTIIFRLLHAVEEIKDGSTLILCDNAIAHSTGLLDSFSATKLAKSPLSAGRSTYAGTINDHNEGTTTEKQYSTPFSIDSPMSSDVFTTHANSPGQSAGYVKVFRTHTKAAQTDLHSKSASASASAASASTYQSPRIDYGTIDRAKSILSGTNSVSNNGDRLSNVFRQLNTLRGELGAVRKLQVSAQTDFLEQLGALISMVDSTMRNVSSSPNNPIRRDRELIDAVLWRFNVEQEDALASLSEIENIVRALRNHILSQSSAITSASASASASASNVALAASANALHLCNGVAVTPDEAQYFGEQLESIIQRFRNLLQQFDALDQRLTPIRRQELDLLAKEERFMREEPRALESALKRCQNLNAIIVTLKRIAQLQESHVCEQCKPLQPQSSQSCQNTPATMPRFPRTDLRTADRETTSAHRSTGICSVNDRLQTHSTLPRTAKLATFHVAQREKHADANAEKVLTDSTISRVSVASTASSSNSSADTVVQAKM